MPELPEVEVVRQGLAPRIGGQRTLGATTRQRALRWPVPVDLDERLRGGRVAEVGRRGKYLLVAIDDDARRTRRGWLLIHLGMSGRLTVVAPNLTPLRHDHVDIILEGAVLRLNDPRRFGAVLWHDQANGPPESHPLLAGLGVEPFAPAFAGDAGAQLLFQASRGRRVPVKAFLLDGQTVVGVGNIYASETLHAAGIHPLAAAGRISLTRYRRLANAIRATLAEAIARGGSTIRDFVASDGQQGHFQESALVYGRAGAPCRGCGTAVRQVVIAQRSTFYCPRCQRP